MLLEQFKDWLKANTEVGDGIQIGGIEGEKERFIGVYPARQQAGSQRVCLGGPIQTRWQARQFTVLVHWTRSIMEAEKKADELHSLLYAKSDINMGSVRVLSIDPGAAPLYVGKDARGICEFAINLKITVEKE